MPPDEVPAMPGRTRVCAGCGVVHATETSTCVPNMNNGRNYYYCPECTPRQTFQCCHCGRRLRNPYRAWSSYNTPGHCDHPELFNMNPVTSREVWSLCGECEDAFNRCANCDMRALATEIVDGTCPHCQYRAPLCTICGRVTRSGDSVTANYLDADVGRICMHCLRTPASTTFERLPYRRSVGFEIECCVPSFTMAWAQKLAKLGRVKDDASLRPRSGHYRYEFCSAPRAGDHLLEQIDQVCGLLAEGGAYVNQSCGLHVHVGLLPDEQLDTLRNNLISWWPRLETVFFNMVERSRRDNTYCRYAVGSNWPMVRYTALNLEALYRHQTIEFRLHEGCLDAKEIRDWVRLLLSFVETFGAFSTSVLPQEELDQALSTERGKLMFVLQQMKVPLSMRKWAVAAIKKKQGALPQKGQAPTPPGPAGRLTREMLEQLQSQLSVVSGDIWAVNTNYVYHAPTTGRAA